MTNNVIRWAKPLTSLRLTVFCLACAMILVFLGTLDQVNIGVYEAESRYFKSFFLYFPPPGTSLKFPWFPSGYLVGGLLLLNVIAAHLARFKLTWKKAGILVLHSGVILLLFGQLFTSLFQVESQMRLDQGETKNYSLSYYQNELTVIDTSAPDFDQVISIPDSQLYKNHKIDLPVDSLAVGIDEYFINSALFPSDKLPSSNYPHLQIGPMAVSVQQERTYKENERNMPTAAVGRWLLDVFMMPRRADAAKVFEVTSPDILGLFGRQEADGKPVSYSYNDCEPFLGEIGKQAGLATQTEAQTRNAFQRGIIKLRDALRIYLLLKNSIQAEDSPDFARELQAF